MAESIVIDGIDPVMFRVGKIRAKADGRQELEAVRCGEGGQALHQGDNASDPFRQTDLFHQCRDIFFFFSTDEDAPPGFFQQAAYGLGLGQVQECIAPEIFGKMDDGGMDGIGRGGE